MTDEGRSLLTSPQSELEALLGKADAAEPGSRIEYRDRIASEGSVGVHAMYRWAVSHRHRAFALRTIGRVWTLRPEARNEVEVVQTQFWACSVGG